jgi:hypothetical protein
MGATKEYQFLKGQVVSYDPVCARAAVQIDEHDGLVEFFIGDYSSGRPSRPPTVGERVAVKVYHQSDHGLVIVQAQRIADK